MINSVLIIYTDKETGEYSHFDKIRITEKMPLEKVESIIAEYNLKDSCTTRGKIYTDPLLCAFAGDVSSSRIKMNFVEDLRSALQEIEDAADRVSWEVRELNEYLGRREDEDDERITC